MTRGLFALDRCPKPSIGLSIIMLVESNTFVVEYTTNEQERMTSATIAKKSRSSLHFVCLVFRRLYFLFSALDEEDSDGIEALSFDA